jgi:hypothetical protein
MISETVPPKATKNQKTGGISGKLYANSKSNDHNKRVNTSGLLSERALIKKIVKTVVVSITGTNVIVCISYA